MQGEVGVSALVTAVLASESPGLRNPREGTVPIAQLPAFRLLGPLEVGRDGARVALGGLHRRAVLAFLLLRAAEEVTADRLIGALWSTEPPPTARKIVQNAVSGLRTTLARTGLACRLGTAPAGYRLDVSPDDVDLNRHEALMACADRYLATGSWDRAAGTIREALALWRGRPLSDLAGSAFAPDVLVPLRAAHLRALAKRAVADLMLGHHAEVTAGLTAVLAAEPTDEGLCALQMLALYRSGRQADALRTYQRTSAALEVAPGRRLRGLEHAVLTHGPELMQPQIVLGLAA
jgi:DNA-binding SARP family transcriptional activator